MNDFTENRLRPAAVDVVKWIATLIQLVGYGLTGMNVVPWNVFAFFAGIVLWRGAVAARVACPV